MVAGDSGRDNGDVIAVPEIEDEKGFEQWKGKLAGKIVLYGNAPKINPDPANPLEHYDAAKLEHFASYPLNGDQEDGFVLPNDPPFWEGIFKHMAFKEKVAKFFADEHAVAVLVPGGSGGAIHDDTGELDGMVRISARSQASHPFGSDWQRSVSKHAPVGLAQCAGVVEAQHQHALQRRSCRRP